MKMICPNNPDHRHFLTTAHVMEEWLVDEHGNFCDRKGFLEVTHEPDFGNTWTCADCHAEAIPEAEEHPTSPESLKEVPS